jgi:hypothetical protein
MVLRLCSNLACKTSIETCCSCVSGDRNLPVRPRKPVPGYLCSRLAVATGSAFGVLPDHWHHSSPARRPVCRQGMSLGCRGRPARPGHRTRPDMPVLPRRRRAARGAVPS